MLPAAVRTDVNASSSATRASAAWRAATSWRRAAASCARRLSTSCRDCLRPLLRLLGPLPRRSLPLHPRVRFRKVRQLPSRLRIVKAQPSPGQPQLQPQHLARQCKRPVRQLPPRQPPILPRAQLQALQRWFRPTARGAAPDDRDRRHGGRRVTPQVRLRRRRQSGHYGSAERAVYYTECEDSELAATTRSLEAWPKGRREANVSLCYRCHAHCRTAWGTPRPRPGWRCCANSRRIRKSGAKCTGNSSRTRCNRTDPGRGRSKKYASTASRTWYLGCYTHAAGCVRCGVSGLGAPCRRAAEPSLT